MKHNLFLFLCLSGLVAVSVLQTVPYKYSLVMKLMTWSDAQSYCRTMYTDLATIVNATDWLKLEKEAARKYYTGPAWIGLYNEIYNWRWTFNNISLNTVTYINWEYWYSAFTFGACGFICYSSYWCDSPCAQTRRFICYNAQDTGTARFVGISSLYLTWPQARDYCRTYYTDLACSLNSTDNSLLGQIHNTQGDSWIGLYNDNWIWSDGTVSDFQWAPEQITYYLGSGCATAYNGQFNQETCTNLHYFYCYTFRPEREQQIMRLQVESDASVFDPVVQSSILKQIKQKLIENGMVENITVTWRVQLDGNIFYKENENKF